MTQLSVLVVGATGQTGQSILNALIEAKTFRIVCLVRPESADKPATKRLASLSVEIRHGRVDDPVDTLLPILKDIDVVVSAVGPDALLAQKNLATAAATVGTVKRFVPCGYITACPRGGIMVLRDEKEEVQDHIKKLYLPYTYIDCGFWYEISFFHLPSGRSEYAQVRPITTIEGNPDARNMLTALPDVGRYVARIITDDRTINKYVSVWAENLSQNDLLKIQEDVSGEDIRSALTTVPESKLVEALQAAEATYNNGTEEQKKNHDPNIYLMMWVTQYNNSRYVREDNTPEHAKYLGYLDAQELYPDFKPMSFREFLKDVLLGGTAKKPYAEKSGMTETFKKLQAEQKK